MTKETVTALMMAPKMPPVVVKLYKDKQFLKQAVSIGAESLCNIGILPFRGVGILYGEEAAVYCAPANRKIGERILAGVIYMVGFDNGELVSLPKEDIKIYRELFWEPEDFDTFEAVVDVLNFLY